jgi:hypothetical protein
MFIICQKEQIKKKEIVTLFESYNISYMNKFIEKERLKELGKLIEWFQLLVLDPDLPVNIKGNCLSLIIQYLNLYHIHDSQKNKVLNILYENLKDFIFHTLSNFSNKDFNQPLISYIFEIFNFNLFFLHKNIQLIKSIIMKTNISLKQKIEILQLSLTFNNGNFIKEISDELNMLKSKKVLNDPIISSKNIENFILMLYLDLKNDFNNVPQHLFIFKIFPGFNFPSKSLILFFDKLTILVRTILYMDNFSRFKKLNKNIKVILNYFELIIFHLQNQINTIPSEVLYKVIQTFSSLVDHNLNNELNPSITIICEKFLKLFEENPHLITQENLHLLINFQTNLFINLKDFLNWEFIYQHLFLSYYNVEVNEIYQIIAERKIHQILTYDNIKSRVYELFSAYDNDTFFNYFDSLTEKYLYDIADSNINWVSILEQRLQMIDYSSMSISQLQCIFTFLMKQYLNDPTQISTFFNEFIDNSMMFFNKNTPFISHFLNMNEVNDLIQIKMMIELFNNYEKSNPNVTKILEILSNIAIDMQYSSQNISNFLKFIKLNNHKRKMLTNLNFAKAGKFSFFKDKNFKIIYTQTSIFNKNLNLHPLARAFPEYSLEFH